MWGKAQQGILELYVASLKTAITTAITFINIINNPAQVRARTAIQKIKANKLLAGAITEIEAPKQAKGEAERQKQLEAAQKAQQAKEAKAAEEAQAGGEPKTGGISGFFRLS